MSFDPSQIIVGALLGLASTGGLRWWQYRRDLWLGRVEHFCKTLETAADVATKYWVEKRNNSTRDSEKEIFQLEMQLLGFQNKLDGMLASFSERLRADDQTALDKLMASMSESLTGGQFGSAARAADPDRARLAQTVSSDLIVLARASADRAITIGGYAIYVKERSARRQAWALGDPA